MKNPERAIWLAIIILFTLYPAIAIGYKSYIHNVCNAFIITIISVFLVLFAGCIWTWKEL